MDIFIVVVVYLFCLCVAGWILMMVVGAFGLSLGFWPCVSICVGISLLRLLL